jgi:metal-responsive CopG/Arc/MetJ family transcriptional regulator
VRTVISIPDDVFRAAERVAKRLGISRSELYTRALRRLLRSLEDDAIRDSYDRAYADAETPTEARFRRTTAKRGLVSIEWDDA